MYVCMYVWIRFQRFCGTHTNKHIFVLRIQTNIHAYTCMLACYLHTHMYVGKLLAYTHVGMATCLCNILRTLTFTAFRIQILGRLQNGVLNLHLFMNVCMHVCMYA